ncbi:MAG: hypothetical protein H0U73_13330 [Tatlockia sp.]|nr:hypothetical protein [Tatlockia sp.]
MELISTNQEISKRSQILFLFTLLLTVVAAKGLHMLLLAYFHPAAPKLSLLLSPYLPYVAPKPIERTMFLTLGLFVPVVVLFLARNKGLFSQTKLNPISLVLPLIITSLLFFPLLYPGYSATAHSDYFTLIMQQEGIPESHYTLILYSFAGATLWCLWSSYSKFSEIKPGLMKAFLWLIVVSLMILSIAAWRVGGMDKVMEYEQVHIDAIIYATTQVIAGKTLLVDLPSQYGLFPELIAPLLRLIKPTILNFSLIFATLQIISLLGLLFVLFKLVKNAILLLAGSISLLAMTYQSILYFSANLHDRYWQYWPIRFFWPAISVLAFYWFAKKKTLWRSSLVSAVGAIGTFWVVDTGLFITLAFAGYLTAKFLIALQLPAGNTENSDSKFYIKALGLHIVITVLLVAMLLIGIWVKAQQPLHLSMLFQYHKIFYGLGFFMQILPQTIHPWMSILGIYLLGAITGLVSCYRNPTTLRADIILFLSMLGLGIFVYYEGRSHVYVLLIIGWPALMIMIITADRTLHYIRSKALGLREIWIPIATLSFLFISSFNYIYFVPKMYEEARLRIKTRHEKTETVRTSELSFIKHYSQGKRECLILSRYQGIYYAETGLLSPSPGPGLAETILKSDLEKTVKPLLDGQLDCVFIGIAKDIIPDMLNNVVGNEVPPALGFNLAELKKKYKLVAENPEHTMVYMTKIS